MTLAEAERRARSNLYRLEDNAVLLERKEDLAEIIRGRGSRVEQQYDDKSGKVSARYVEATPSWFLALQSVEWAEYELWCAVSTVRSLLGCLKERECYLDLCELYEMKYRAKAQVPEVKRRFGQKLKRLDQDLVFMLILWHSWPIDQTGGEVFESWRRKKGY